MVYDVIIIGGGQAGLAAGYFLQKLHLRFLIVDQEKRTGNSWRKRYDSLTLFSPRISDSLPGMNLSGNQDEYPTKDEMADYLETYAKSFNLPILHNISIISLTKTNTNFQLQTKDKKVLVAKQVIVATGGFNAPFIPKLAGSLSPHIKQLHSHEYINPHLLLDGSTLIVGAGNSGVQIALETKKYHKTYLSCGSMPFLLPKKIWGKSIFWWARKVGILYLLLHCSRDSFFGKLLFTKDRNPIIGNELSSAIKTGEIIPKKPTVSYQKDSVSFSDGSFVTIRNLIWATGYRNNFDWIHIPGLFYTNGKLKHKKGITHVPGLYFLGLEWLSSKVSSELLGVGRDAEYIVKYLHSHEKNL